MSDGKLLRGEKWEKFKVPSKADFYIAVNGNDAWSGTLPEPNEAGTDGPFATIQRAKRLCMILRLKFTNLKRSLLRHAGSVLPHPFGKGKDILVLIRGRFYQLKQPLIFNPEDGG